MPRRTERSEAGGDGSFPKLVGGAVVEQGKGLVPFACGVPGEDRDLSAVEHPLPDVDPTVGLVVARN